LENFAHSTLFSDAEKAALRLAEAMCERSVTVPDAVFEEVRRHFDEKAIVELVAMIALENMRARFNRALEIPSDGLCQLPADHPAMTAAAAGR
jgi:alkylhydroperoxidase family enzyme